MKFEDLLKSITTTHATLQAKATQSVNQFLTIRNWCIGAYIVEYEQNGNDRAKYGSKLFGNLAKQLKSIKGLRSTELKRCRRFYLTYPLFSLVIGENILPASIRQTLSVELKTNENEEIGLTRLLLKKMSYSHLSVLMTIEDAKKRRYYEILTLKTTPSVRELQRQINTLSYERLGLSTDKNLSFEKIKQAIAVQSPQDAVRDMYVFEFLGLSSQQIFDENDLESALIAHLQEFILELGNGFCFEARQKRILIGDDYFFIDLVFYHRLLKCHILIELKVDKMQVGHIAQLQTYLNYYQEEIKEENDNPPIGILLVTDKNEALVRYAMPTQNNDLFISKYKVQLPTEEELQNFILKELKKR
ncbi:PDDEXK nuclease domain-containing protein [Bernardetia sp.]|uniref:PDDEXK nuclease domain-containing protein n=1 Tax=Bernardetia sp. TaxID=1937974 RepID=UPI0025BDAEF8|nr:PDDEXK nuclease domain-containing protein [Bernardetia sp.]